MAITFFHPVKEFFGAYPRNGFFTGGINFCQYRDIRFPENSDKLIHEGLGARIAMGLKNNNQSFPGPDLSAGLQHRLNLSRMMPIIVQNRNAFDFAAYLKTSLDPRVGGQSLLNFLKREAQFHAHSQRGQRVFHVVNASGMNRDGAQSLSPMVDLKKALKPPISDLSGLIITPGGNTVSDHPFV